ncbi:FtsX-like permease family protein [Sphingomonas silueang]|uniref:FtsX-like permease family protein n=1 Tax=Sphingomonas silueang TaxID=3156617 RepID=UPI0032B54B02
MMAIAAELAWKDWRHEWAMSLCLAIGVAAAAMPLLLLLSVGGGILRQMWDELDRHPASRELIATGQPVVPPALIERLRNRRDVAFVAPQTRLLAAGAVVRAPNGDGAAVDMVPSGAGDPLLDAPWRPGTIALSDAVARKLGVGRGDAVTLSIERVRRDGTREQARIAVRVVQVAAAQQADSSRAFVLVDPALLLASEVWRDSDDDRPLRALVAAGSRPMRYAGLRLYARTLHDVAPLRTLLLDQGIATDSRIDAIRLVARLERGLDIFLLVIGAMTATGLGLSLAAAEWSWVERKRRDFSYLRLIGLPPHALRAVPLAHAVLVVSPGIVLAVLLACGGQALLNMLFAGQLGTVQGLGRIAAGDVALVAGIALAAALAAGAAAAANAARTSPILALRGSE